MPHFFYFPIFRYITKLRSFEFHLLIKFKINKPEVSSNGKKSIKRAILSKAGFTLVGGLAGAAIASGKKPQPEEAIVTEEDIPQEIQEQLDEAQQQQAPENHDSNDITEPQPMDNNHGGSNSGQGATETPDDPRDIAQSIANEIDPNDIDSENVINIDSYDYAYLPDGYPPYNYEESRNSNMIDLQASGCFAAHFINTVSPTFLKEIVNGWHSFIPDSIRSEIRNKFNAGCAAGILNAPDSADNPETDDKIPFRYGPENHVEMKRKNKLALQHALGLEEDADKALFFWPSRLDPIQKGPQLLTDITYRFLEKHPDAQLAIIANGPYQQPFWDIQNFHGIQSRLGIHNFDARLSALGFAGSDFTLMPSLFEPCGLPQMQAPIYGSLAVAHNTGGLHDTVETLDAAASKGNGFVFDNYDSNGLFWAMDQAMDFFHAGAGIREREISRIMTESRRRFNHEACAKEYIKLYEQMLDRPLVKKTSE